MAGGGLISSICVMVGGRVAVCGCSSIIKLILINTPKVQCMVCSHRTDLKYPSLKLVFTSIDKNKD